MCYVSSIKDPNAILNYDRQNESEVIKYGFKTSFACEFFYTTIMVVGIILGSLGLRGCFSSLSPVGYGFLTASCSFLLLTQVNQYREICTHLLAFSEHAHRKK